MAICICSLRRGVVLGAVVHSVHNLILLYEVVLSNQVYPFRDLKHRCLRPCQGLTSNPIYGGVVYVVADLGKIGTTKQVRPKNRNLASAQATSVTTEHFVSSAKPSGPL